MNDASDESMKGEKNPLVVGNCERRRNKASSDDAFDVWLDHGLRQMFGGVDKEPIPPELLALIKRDQEKG